MLITLAIIGVVAAMTIPTLIGKYEKFVLKTQFKKSYSMLNQALKLSVVDFGRFPLCAYYEGQSGYKNADCAELAETLKKTLKIVKSCENNALANGCIPEYKGVEEVLKDNHKNDENYDEDAWENYSKQSWNGWRKENITKNNSAYVLNDGTIIVPYTQFSVYWLLVLVDINGTKGPNKWGHDLFTFHIKNKNGSYIYEANSGVEAEEGGLNTGQMLEEAFK